MAKIVLHKSSGVDFQCPHCGQVMNVERDMQGVAFDCPACGKPTECPQAASLVKSPKAGDDTQTLAAIARSTAETAKAVTEIRNLIAAVMLFWLLAIIGAVVFVAS